MNTHDKGKQLELRSAEQLQEIFQENPPIIPTKASSGGSHNTEIGDLKSVILFGEIKNDGNWFKLKVWQKLLNSIPFGSKKIPIYIQNHKIEGVMVCLTFADFCRLLKMMKEK